MINNNWTFGNQARIEFTGRPLTNPNVLNGTSMATQREGCASISDNSGSLLFYTDGQSVWDSTHVQIATGLGGHNSSTSSAIILPVPNSSTLYYIFCVDTVIVGGGTDGLSYHIVDISTNPYSVSGQNNLITTPNITAEKVCATIKDNCTDFWLVTCGRGNNNFYVFDINFDVATNSNQITALTVQNPTGSPNIGVYGYMKFSKSGRFLAVANSELGNTSVEMYFFNKLNGSINFLYTINVPAISDVNNKIIYGIEFSDNERYLYFSHTNGTSASTNTTAEIYQYDLILRSLENSGNFIQQINVGAGISGFGALQISPENGTSLSRPIYITRPGTSNLDAILNPNNPFPTNNFTSNHVNLGSAIAQLGLPTLVQTGNCCFCNCNDCNGCNENAKEQNEELFDRVGSKFNDIPATTNGNVPFCQDGIIPSGTNFSPYFYFHWGDGTNDQLEEHDTEVFYLTICNNHNDITYRGLRITKVTLIPAVPIDKIHIVPDRFINIDCLEPCSCQVREFAMINRANDTAGNYTLEVEYCYDEVVINSSGNSGKAEFPVTITED